MLQLTIVPPVNIVIPTSHRKREIARTPVSLSAFARTALKRPRNRDLVFTPLPAGRVMSAWLAIAVVVRVNEALREGVLTPLLGFMGAQIISAILGVAGVLAVTSPFFRVYAGQWGSTLAWYGFVLAALTVAFETLFELYVRGQYGFEVREQYNVLHGQLWPVVVVAIALTPLIWARWKES